MPLCNSEIQGKNYLEPLHGSSNPSYGHKACFTIKRAAYR